MHVEGDLSEKVRSAPLEKPLLPSEIESVCVIKIDVEGAESLVFKGMRPLPSRLPPDAEIVMEITPELSGADDVVGVLAREGWNAYALKPQDSIENFFLPAKPSYTARISGAISTRTDVMFSRIETDRIIYTSWATARVCTAILEEKTSVPLWKSIRSSKIALGGSPEASVLTLVRTCWPMAERIAEDRGYCPCHCRWAPSDPGRPSFIRTLRRLQ